METQAINGLDVGGNDKKRSNEFGRRRQRRRYPPWVKDQRSRRASKRGESRLGTGERIRWHDDSFWERRGQTRLEQVFEKEKERGPLDTEVAKQHRRERLEKQERYEEQKQYHLSQWGMCFPKAYHQLQRRRWDHHRQSGPIDVFLVSSGADEEDALDAEALQLAEHRAGAVGREQRPDRVGLPPSSGVSGARRCV